MPSNKPQFAREHGSQKTTTTKAKAGKQEVLYKSRQRGVNVLFRV